MITNVNSSKGTPTVKEQVVAVLELLSTRMQWATARRLISATSLHVSRGWQETLTNIRQGVFSDVIWQAACKALSTVVTSHAQVGNKQVSFYDLREQNKDNRKKIISWAKESSVANLASHVQKSPFTILSAPTAKTLLDNFKDKPPILVSAKLAKDKLYLQYFSTRSYTWRESIALSELTPSQQKPFVEYEGLIGVRTKSVPCFDTVVIDTQNELIEIRIDFQPGMTGDKDTPALARVIDEFNRVTTKFVGLAAAGVGLIDLYPAINPMYKDERCGSVTALGFVATGKETSSNNHGKIHRTKTKDFRKDEFHVGGKSHVEEIKPYAIGVTWKNSTNDLSLELRGNLRAVYAKKLNSVSVAEIVGCTSEADFEFVTEQVLRRLKRRNSED
jgi:hypothetical protein